MMPVVLVCRCIAVTFRNKLGRTWNSRGGTMGDLLVNASLIAPATNKTHPTVISEIVDADDPSEGDVTSGY
jgi:hypothetical protein